MESTSEIPRLNTRVGLDAVDVALIPGLSGHSLEPTEVIPHLSGRAWNRLRKLRSQIRASAEMAANASDSRKVEQYST